MKTLIEGGRIVTGDGTTDRPGNLWLDGDRIAAAGDGTYQGPVSDGDQLIDAAGMIVMPGLIDLHYHTAVGKGYSDHLPLWEYLDACWYPFIRTLDADAAYWSAAASYLESVKCGVTTVNDMYRRLPDLGRSELVLSPLVLDAGTGTAKFELTLVLQESEHGLDHDISQFPLK